MKIIKSSNKSNEMNHMILDLNGYLMFFHGLLIQNFSKFMSNCVRTMYRNQFKTNNYHRTPIGKIIRLR